MVLANQWGRAEQVTLSEREERWQAVLGESGCTLIPVDTIVKNSTFNSSSGAHLLPPAALCEARLVPALLHDDFAGYTTGVVSGSFERWQVRDDAGSAASTWKINQDGTPPDFELAQTNASANSTLVYGNTTDLPLDHPDQPGNWTDYRVTVHLRSGAGKIGVVWRYLNAGQHYRFVMDLQAGKCDLIRVLGGVPTPLATKSFALVADRRYVVSVEAVGSSFRVSLDGALVFSITDPTTATGGIGLYSSANSNARFTDVVVDDFKTTAPVVYRFSFLSSRFKNFVEQLGSFDNQTRRAQIAPGANVAPQIGAAVSPSSVVSETESRAYDSLFAQLPGVVGSTRAVRVTRVEQNTSAIAFLLQSPEPFDWKRINVQLLSAPLNTPSANYSEIPARVLRKADGAGLFIVSTATGSPGSPLPPAEYRLVFTYRRNNRAVDADSDILSEAGNTFPEEATLQIPWPTQMLRSLVIDQSLVSPSDATNGNGKGLVEPRGIEPLTS